MPCAEILAQRSTPDGMAKLSSPQFRTPVQPEMDLAIIREGCLSEQKFSKFAKRWVVLEKCKVSGCINLKIFRFSETGENPAQSNFKYQYVLADDEFIGCVKAKVGGTKSTAYSWAIIMKSDILQFQDKSRLVCESWISALREHIKYITWQVKIVSGLKSAGQDAIFFLTDHMLAVCHINVSKVMCVHGIPDVADVEAVDSHVKFTANEKGENCVYEVETARASQAARVVAEILARKEDLLTEDTVETFNASEQPPRAIPPLIKIRKESFIPVDTFPTPPSTPSKLSPYNISPASSPNVSPRLPRSNGASDIETIDESDGVVEGRWEGISRGRKGTKLKRPGEHRWERKPVIRRRPRSKTLPELNGAELIARPAPKTPPLPRKAKAAMPPLRQEGITASPRAWVEAKSPPVPARPAWTLSESKTRHFSMDQGEEKSDPLFLSHSATLFSDLHRKLRSEKSVGCARCTTVCTCKDKGYGPVLPQRINMPAASTSISSYSSLEDSDENISSKSPRDAGEHPLSRSQRAFRNATPSEERVLKGKNLSLPNFYLGDGMSLSPASPGPSPRSPSSDNNFFGTHKPPTPASPQSSAHSVELPPRPLPGLQSQKTRKKPPVPLPPRSPPSIPPRASGNTDLVTSRERRPPIPSRSVSLLKSEDIEAASRRLATSSKPIPMGNKNGHPGPPPRSQSATHLSFIARECVVCGVVCQCVDRASMSVKNYVDSIDHTDSEGYLAMTEGADQYVVPDRGDSNYITPDGWDNPVGEGLDQGDTYLALMKMKEKASTLSADGRERRGPQPSPRTCRRNGVDGTLFKKKSQLLRDDTYGIPGELTKASIKRQVAKSWGDIQRIAKEREHDELCNSSEGPIKPPIPSGGRGKHQAPAAGFESSSPGKSVLFELLFEFISKRTRPLDNLGVAPGVWAHFLIALDCENSGNALNDWRGLADFLGLSLNDMKLVDKQCRKSGRFASEFILLYWQTKRSPILPYTKENLFDVLTSLHRRDLIDILKGTDT